MKDLKINENKGYVTPKTVNELPDTFGVYLMKNSDAKVIYVGKAKSLKKRVSSYFHKSHHDEKTRMLVENIHIIDYITVSNEMESLILEATLIKKFSPRYNVQFKDNKFYPFIKVTTREKFPRIMFTRNNYHDGSLYFGPYTSAHSVRRYIDAIQRIFKIRTCRELPNRECLNYHIKRCSAPCIKKIGPDEYKEQVELALRLLRGEMEELSVELEEKMRDAAAKLEFERAQAFKEKLEAIRLFDEGQNVFLQSRIDADFLDFSTKLGKILFVAILIRQGKMIGKRSYSATLQLDEDPIEVFERFLIEYYRLSDQKQQFMVIDEPYRKLLRSVNRYLRDEEKSDIQLIVPENEEQKALIKMAKENATLHMSQVLSRVDASESLGQLQTAIGSDTLPMRIEGFDIANILGEQAAASMVSFYAAKPDKKNYRHYKIKCKDTPDDFAMMHEAVYRRYSRLQREEKEFPDLILIDGGKGQLHAALDAITELGLDLNVISLAKKNEEIYLPGKSEPIVLPKNSPALHVLQRVRDESHRFANTFYNKLKRKAMMSSAFDEIKGIGEKRKKIIVDKFLKPGKVENISPEDLIKEGIPRANAQNVYNILIKIYNNTSKV